MKVRFHFQLVLVFLLIVSAISVKSPASLAQMAQPNATRANLDYGLVAEALNLIERHYVERSAVKAHDMTYGAISGIVDALGDTGHSRFLTPDMVKQQATMTAGELQGIGAELRMKNNQVVIVAPLDDSPAQKAGLKPDDIILKVNGEDIAGLSLDKVVPKILGPSGTTVKLTILNPKTGMSRDVDLVRARVVIHDVTWTRLPGTPVAHLRISAFSRGVGEDLRKALSEIKNDGAAAIILDLRNNPGGLLEQVVLATSEFVGRGNVVLERNASGSTGAIPVRAGGMATEIRMTTLINGGTASGAEIVAGALQDYNRAQLVGEKTFGTGTVLQSFPLSDGSALLLAILEWVTPKGNVIWHKGIAPDVAVSLPPDVMALVPRQEKGMTQAGLRASGDIQLLRALDLLLGETSTSVEKGR